MRWISHMISAANRPAAVLQGWRNDMTDQLSQFGTRANTAEIVKAFGQIPNGIKSVPLPEGITFNLPESDDAQ
jgi:hypothetical protein